MKKLIWTLVILVVIGVFGGRAWWLYQHRETDTNVVKIGVLSYMSGAHATLGHNFVKGATLAKDEFNKENKTVKLVLDIEDSKTDAKTSIFAFNKMLFDKIQAAIIVGDIPVQAILPIIEEHTIPTTVSIAGGSEFLSEKQNKLLLKNWPSIRFMGAYLGRYANETLGLKRVAILSSHNQYGLESAKGFKNGYPTSVVAEEQFKIDSNELKSQVAKIAYTNPDGIYLTGFGRGYIVALKNIKEQLPGITILTDTTVLNPETKENISDLSNIYFVNSVYKDNTKTFEAFKKEYVQAFKEEPTLFSAYGYDAMRMITKAMGKGVSNQNIHNGFQSLNSIETFAGNLTVLPDGDCKLPLMIGKMKADGTYDILEERE